MRTAGGRSRGTKPTEPCRSSHTGCSRSASRRETRSGILARNHASNGCSSTSRSLTSARSTAPIYPSDTAARVALRPRARECRRLPRSTPSSTREGSTASSSSTSSSARRPRRPCARGSRARRAAARAQSSEAPRADRRRRPLHAHLHVGNDRAAEGLHDPQPQLLRRWSRRSTTSRTSSSRAT